MILQARRTVFCCPYCSFVSQAVEQVRAHTISQHAVQPRFRCPLCQEQLMGRTNLRFHLTHIHNVVSECVEKLLLVATTVELTFATKVLPVPNLTKNEESQKPTCSTPDPRPAKDPDDEPSSSAPADPPEPSYNNYSTDPGDEDASLDRDPRRDPEEPDCSTHEEQKCRSDPLCLLACPWCQQRTESLPELKEHLENEHPELGGSEIQQLCLPQLEAASRIPEDEEESFGAGCPPDPEGLEDRPVPADHESTIATTTSSFLIDSRQPLNYRKSTNFALDKFLDPSRPYKCTVCKESFTQKNILLVHYNSVSHLHKMKKAAIDPSLPSRAEVSGAQDKPFKCSTCRVSYNQSSTLEIHMRSVLHQTRSRVAKLEAASRGPSDQSAGHERGDADSPQKVEVPSSTAAHEQGEAASVSPVEDPPSTEPTRKALEAQCLGVSGLPFMPPQMQMTLDLHRHASLLQAPLFSPPVLPHFPLVPESLLKLQHQQQQLLLPFYLHDLKVSPEMGLAGVSPVLSIQRSSPLATGGGGLLKKPPALKEEPPSVLPPPCTSSIQPQPTPAPGTESVSPTHEQEEEEEGERAAEEGTAEAEEEKTSSEKASSQDTEHQNDSSMPPPRIPTDVSRTAAKALLEDFGFELVIQYNEGKQPPPVQQQQQQPPAPVLPQPPLQTAPAPQQQQRPGGTASGEKKLKCEACGKLFSNMLILKTHEEHVHRRFLPFEALCCYAAQFRKSYDSMYPLRPTAAATSAEPPAPPSKALPAEAALAQAAPLAVPQLPIPLDFSVCPPFLMQSIPLQALPAILPSPPPPLPQLPSMNSLVTTALAKVGDSAEVEQVAESRSPRTRITPEQLKILWNYFDINNLPSEETVLQMAEHTGLPAKVVKHWFRNRLFKERQQDKDSPYNFNNPPASSLPLEEEEEEEEEEEPGEAATLTLLRTDHLGSRRFSRTKFTDYQFQALQSFFEASAYPKDSEVERLSQLLGLPSRVVVVWFQNARQKARKNAAEAPFQGAGKGQDPSAGGDRCVFNGNKQNLCKKCNTAYSCIFQLIGHMKKCYEDQLCDEESEEALIEAEAGALEIAKYASLDSENHYNSPLTATIQQQKAPSSQENPVASDVQAQAMPEANECQEGAKREQEDKVDEMVSQTPEATQIQTLAEEETEELNKPQPKDPADEAKPFSTTMAILTEQPVLSPQAAPMPPVSGDTSNVYSCEQCRASFANPELLGKHQSLHILASTQLPGSLLDPPLLMFDRSGPLLPGPLLPAGPLTLAPPPLTDSTTAAQATRKRKLEEEGLSPTESEAGYLGDEPPKDKRLRTTILPEQLEILHRWYMQDSNPTRKMLDCISEEVGLKKRVVQVWFQNTRARERKGQFRCVAPALPPAKPYTKFLPPVGKAEMARESPRHHHAEPSPAGTLLAQRNPAVGALEGLKREAAVFYSTAGMPLPNTLLGKIEVSGSGNTPSAPAALVLPDSPSVSNTNSANHSPDDQEAEEEPKVNLEMEEAGHKKSPPPPLEMEDLSDSSSLADPESPNPGVSAASRHGDGFVDPLGQRRFRTQMSSLQLKIMKACYASYRTPTMQECEVLGSEIKLQKRVIQVWFQNARAKEKKAKLQGLTPPEAAASAEATPSPRGECAICNVKYDFYVSCRSHIFSRQHITRLKEVIQRQLNSEVKYYDTTSAPCAPQLKPSAATSSVSPGFSPAVGFQSTGGAVGATSLPRLGPLLLSGQGIPAPIGGLAPFNSGPPSSLLGVSASVAPALLPVPSLPSRPVPQKPPPDQTSAEPVAETSPEKQHSEGRAPPPPPGKAHHLPEPPAAAGAVPRPKNLKPLQAAISGGPGCGPLLGGQFLPFSLPGTPALFSPQVQGAYFQQLYGMKKSLFPMNPVIPQTLIGLLPSSLLQPEPKPAPEPARPCLVSPPAEGAPSAPCQPQAEAAGEDAAPPLLRSAGISTVDIAHKYLCRQCEAAFEEEGAALAHQASACCFYGALPGPPPLRLSVCTYHCLPCEVLLNGREALHEHLRSPAHQRRQSDSTFAKEDVKIPHTDSSPKTVTTSAIVA